MKIVEEGNATPASYRAARTMLLLAADRLTRRIHELEPVRTMDEMNALLRLDRERRIVFEMIADCSYVIDWLESGRRPGNRRGIERRAGYQREVPTDPAKLSTVRSACGDGQAAGRPGDERRKRLEAALRGLTERERECYRLALGEGFSYAEVAGLLDISKSSVGTYIIRAQRKIAMNIGERNDRVG
ncbi:sigma factor-like helix-turn-helix DNA-binding protein [Cohnella sp. REN36]|uniref:sigma factor-like helix-turn-helix DNA-binding protein n=1 Tax=Cohnella sp. REN36 TaxID=2887347 RepID=UPI001D1469F2|nr:sigma factor-like helix-turn-helix DNA-binding protein [Cohnella sp. REN36]MCC3374730.1 LuxR C-terminal-related transcriptional regulator [Cohnella sp. REN36]